MDIQKNARIDIRVECPVCFDNCPGEIYVCRNGHSLCGNCSKTIHRCPLCQVPMTTLRNRALEKLVAEITAKNPNHSNLADHQEDCFECAASSQDSANLQIFLDKFRHTYVKCNRNRSFNYQHLFKNTEQYDFVVVQFNDDLFKCCVKMDNTAQTFCFAMQKYDYQEEDANKYTLELKCVYKAKNPFGVIQIGEMTEDLERAFDGPFASIEKGRFLQPSPDVIAVKVYCRFKTKAASASV